MFMVKKLFFLVILCLLSSRLFGEGSGIYGNLQGIEQSIEILSQRLDKLEPLLKKIEWRSYQVKLNSTVEIIENELKSDKDQYWVAAPWRKQVARLLNQVRQAESILQHRLENYQSVQLAFSEGDMPVQLDPGLEAEQNEVRQAIEITNARLTQLRVVHQRLKNADDSLAGYQRRLRNETIAKEDQLSVFSLDTYEQSLSEFQEYFTELYDSRLLKGEQINLNVALLLWAGLWLIILVAQYRFNQKNAGKPPVQAPQYSYSRALVALIPFILKVTFCLVALILIAIAYVNTILVDVNLPENTTMGSLEYIFMQNSEYWPEFIMAVFLIMFINILLALLVRTISSPAIRFHAMTRLSRHATSWVSILVLLFFLVQNVSDILISPLSLNDSSLGLGSAAKYVLTVSIILLQALLLFLLGQRQCWELSAVEDNTSTRNTPFIIIQHCLLPVKIIAIAAILLTLAGRSGFAAYLVENTLLLLVVVFLFMIFQAAVKDFIYKFGQKKALLSSMEVEINEGTLKTYLHVVYFAVIGYSCFFVLIKLAVLLGIPEADINANLSKLWNGFSVGNINVSLYNIISAFCVLAALILLNGFIKRLLRSFLQSTQRISESSKASVVTSVGYIGMIIAVTASIAVLGVNLTSIALIASGLTLGIGFGLQTIFSNFISGVILLLERPVSIGDWVIVDGNEGIVSDVRFRATEIKTFDKASVLVPNSSFVSNVVTNMTHQERILRITIAVGVAYDSDTDKVREVLFGCVNSVPGILETPDPSVFFMDFGESSLDFQLRCFTEDALNSVHLASELRFRINSAFKEHDIEMPFPKRVIQFDDAGKMPEQIETLSPVKT